MCGYNKAIKYLNELLIKTIFMNDQVIIESDFVFNGSKEVTT